MLIPGILLAIIRFHYGFKISVFDLKVFAIYSSFFETKTLTFVTNNLTEEFAGVLMLAGLLLIAFSKEETENEIVFELRLRSFILSFYLNSFLIAIALFTVFGLGFVEVMSFNLISTLVIYIIIFKFSLYKQKLKHESVSPK